MRSLALACRVGSLALAVLALPTVGPGAAAAAASTAPVTATDLVPLPGAVRFDPEFNR